jgi:hypothetical protein
VTSWVSVRDYPGFLVFERCAEVGITHVAAFAGSDTANAFLNGIPPEFERKIIEWAYEVTEELSEAMLAGAKGMSVTNKTQLGADLSELREELLVKFVDKIEEHKTRTTCGKPRTRSSISQGRFGPRRPCVGEHQPAEKAHVHVARNGRRTDRRGRNFERRWLHLDRPKTLFLGFQESPLSSKPFWGPSLTAAEVGSDA